MPAIKGIALLTASEHPIQVQTIESSPNVVEVEIVTASRGEQPANEIFRTVRILPGGFVAEDRVKTCYIADMPGTRMAGFVAPGRAIAWLQHQRSMRAGSRS